MQYAKASVVKAKSLLEFRTPQDAAMWAGDQREAAADVYPAKAKHWREVEDILTHYIHTGELPNA